MSDHEPCAFCGKHIRNTDADQSDITLCPLCDLGRTFALGGIDTDSHIARELFAEAEARCVAILPPVADEIDELNAWFDARRDEAVEVHAADADQSTRDDGFLFYDRLPCDDVDYFNPQFAAFARAPITAPLEPLPAWMERRHGGDPIGTGLPVGWEVL